LFAGLRKRVEDCELRLIRAESIALDSPAVDLQKPATTIAEVLATRDERAP
jgi:hypothetical protein